MASISLYHGSNVPIERPDITHNTGFADLGHGFYLTDDHEAAVQRARLRARSMGGVPIVSRFELDEGCVPWVTWGSGEPPLPDGFPAGPFGLRFEESPGGYAAWARYIKACRQGRTEVPGVGTPAVVRAWIANMEVEMVCSDFMTAEEFGDIVEPSKITVQYCLLDQGLIERHLAFVEAEDVSA